MSGSGAPATAITPGLAGRPPRLAIVAAQWHDAVMNGLIDGATRLAAEAGITPDIIRVPGSFELPLGAQRAAADHDAVVALGVVIRGGTPHFDYVCDGATAGLMRVMLDTGVPVGFGLLTCEDERQALDRAGLEGSVEDKGREAAAAALAMVLGAGAA